MPSLCDDYLLIALYDGQDSLATGLLDDTINAVALAELALHGRIVWNGENLTVTSTTEIGDPVVDGALRSISQKSISGSGDMGWIAEYTSGLQCGQQVLGRLLQRGVLRQEERKRWGILSSTIWQDDGITRPAILNKVRSVMVDRHQPAPYMATLIFLHGVSSGTELVEKRDRKAYEKRYEELYSDYWGHMPEMNPNPLPIPGLEDLARRTIGEIAVSLGNIVAGIWTDATRPDYY